MGRIMNEYTYKVTGFTLIELMVTIAIIGTLAGIATPMYINYIEKAKIARCTTEMKMIERAITIYFFDVESYPSSLSDIGMDSILDPWGNPYEYLNIETAKGKGKLRKDHSLVPINSDFDLYSKGPDGKSQSPLTANASRDDIIRANNGQFFGVASDY